VSGSQTLIPGPHFRVLEGFDCSTGIVRGTTGFIRLLLLENGEVDVLRARERLSSAGSGPGQATLRGYASSWRSVLQGQTIHDAARRVFVLPPSTTCDLWEFREAHQQARLAPAIDEAVARLEEAEAAWVRSEREQAQAFGEARMSGARSRDLRRWGPLAEDYALLVLQRMEVRLQLSSLLILLGERLDEVASRIEGWLANPPGGLAVVRSAGFRERWLSMETGLTKRRIHARYCHLAPLRKTDWERIRTDVLRSVAIGDRQAFEDVLHRRPQRIRKRLAEHGFRCVAASLAVETPDTPAAAEPPLELVGRAGDRGGGEQPAPVRSGTESVIAPRRADNATRQESEDVRRETRERLHPPDPEELVGRDSVLATLGEEIDLEHFPVQLYGGPGMGKSAVLARLVASRDVTCYWIDLQTPGLGTAAAVTRLLARALSVRRPAGDRSDSLDRDLRSTLAEQPDHLVVLDNVEPSAAHAALVGELQAVTRRLVVCGREQLSLSGHARPHRLHRIVEGMSERLWLRAGGPPADDEVLRAICHDCLAGHPYAVVLIAAATRSLHLRSGAYDWFDLERRLWECHHQARTLFGGDHPELRAAYQCSLDTLPDRARRVLDDLVVCAPSGVGSEWLRMQTSTADDAFDRAVGELLSRRLIREHRGDRYTWHPMLVEHAGLLPERRGHGGPGLRGNLVRHLEAAEQYARRHCDDFAQLERERDNLVLGVQGAAALRRWNQFGTLWRTLEEWLETTGDHNCLAAIEEAVLTAAGDVPVELRGRALFSRGLRRAGDRSMASLLQDVREALSIARRVGDHVLTARALVAVWTYQSEVIGKGLEDDLLEEARQLTAEHGLDAGLAAEVTYLLGRSSWHRGHAADAERWLKLAFDHARGRPRCPYGAFAYRLLGDMALASGDLQDARLYLEKAVDMHQCDELPRARGVVWKSLARLEHAAGQDEKMVTHLRRAEDAFSSIGDDAAAVRALARHLPFLEDDERGAALRRADSLIARIAHPRLRALSLCAVGFGLAEMGQQVAGSRYARDARALLGEADLTADDLGKMAHDQGRLWQRLDDPGEAVTAFRTAIEQRRVALVTTTADDASTRWAVLAGSLRRLGDALRAAGEDEPALDSYVRALEIVKALPRACAGQQGVALWRAMAEIHTSANRPTQARSAHLSGARMCAQLIENGRWHGRQRAALERWRAIALLAAGRPEEALVAYEKAAGCLEALPVLLVDDLAGVHTERGDLLETMGRAAEAAGAYREAVRRLQENHAGDESVARALERLAGALGRYGEGKEAAAASARARQLLGPQRRREMRVPPHSV
jgi:tetratricopeptide (TPR) repeat protein